VTQLAQALQEKGFHYTVQYVSQINGEQILQLGSRYYTVMKAIDGRESDHTSLSDIKKSAQALAKFHLAAQGFFNPSEMVRNKPPLLEKWEERYAQFEKISQQISRRGPQNRMEQLIAGMSKEIKRDSFDVISRAASLPLDRVMEHAHFNGTMAHRDVASHNFLLNDQGDCYLIDLDTVAHDMQLVDLVQFMGRMLLLQGYSVQAFVEAINAYTKVKHLSDGEIWLIHQLLRYPDNFLREVTGVYAKRPGYKAKGVYQLLQLENRYRRERRSLLQAGDLIFRDPSWGYYQISN
ncbi:serine kinase, partial [Bradyrhizobium japonicum]